MRVRTCILLILVLGACLGRTSRGQSPKLPIKLVAAQTDYQKASDKAQAVYDDAIRQATGIYKRQLTESLVSETKIGNLDAAIQIREEIKKAEEMVSPRSNVSTKAALKKVLMGTRWNWGNKPLVFQADGYANHPDWDSTRSATRWEAIDRRTVVLIVERGRGNDRYAILEFSEKLDEYKGYGFDNAARLTTSKRFP